MSAPSTVTARRTALIATTSAGLLAILAAAAGGSDFIRHGSTSASLGMAMATAVAMLCYAVNLMLPGRADLRRPM